MKIDKALEKIGVPRFKDLSKESKLEATRKWREKREATLVKIREAGTTKKGRKKRVI